MISESMVEAAAKEMFRHERHVRVAAINEYWEQHKGELGARHCLVVARGVLEAAEAAAAPMLVDRDGIARAIWKGDPGNELPVVGITWAMHRDEQIARGNESFLYAQADAVSFYLSLAATDGAAT